MAAVNAANSELNFEEAMTLIASCHELLSADSLQAAIRALKHVDPFQEYPIFAEELELLESETVAKDRAHKTHMAFELSQGMVRIRHAEDDVAYSKQANISRDDLQKLKRQLVEIEILVKDNADAVERLKRLEEAFADLAKAREESDKKAFKEAKQLLSQAETANKYNKYSDAKRLSYGSQALLIEAQGMDEDFEQAALVIKTAEENSANALREKRAEFDRLTIAVFEVFDAVVGGKGDVIRALAAADAARQCLVQCIDEQKVLASLEPSTKYCVDWIRWAEESARDISSFCECMQAVVHARVLALSQLPNYYILMSSNCPARAQPIYTVSSFYEGCDLYVPARHIKSSAGESDAALLIMQDDPDESFGTSISPSDALKILEGSMSSPVGMESKYTLTWSAMAAKAQELLEVELLGDKLQAYDDDNDVRDTTLPKTAGDMMVADDDRSEKQRSEPGTPGDDAALTAESERKSAAVPMNGNESEAGLPSEASFARREEGDIGRDESAASESEEVYTPLSSTPVPVAGKKWVSQEQMQSFHHRQSLSPEEMMAKLNESILSHDFEGAKAVLSAGVDVDMFLPLPMTDFEGDTLLLRTVRQFDGSMDVSFFCVRVAWYMHASGHALQDGIHHAVEARPRVMFGI